MADPRLLGLTIAISVLALIVSLVALWKTHFARPTPLVALGQLTHRIYPIRSEKAQWSLTSFSLPVSFSNAGARPLLIKGLRLRLHYPLLPIPGNRELINVDWDIEPKDARKIDKNRFEWLDKLNIRRWMPFTILPKQTEERHFLFETRWDEPVLQERVAVTLEAVTSASNGWYELGKWEINLDADVWGELAHVGTSVSYTESSAIEYEDELRPAGLHKYTGGKEPIPANGFGAAPSYLNFPPQDDDERHA